MKSRVLTMVPLVLAAFAAGWWARGGSAVAGAAGPAGGAPARATGWSGQAAVAGELPTKRPREVAEAFTAADRQRAADDRKRLEERCRAGLERRIAEWERLLDLDAGEVGALRQAIDPLVADADPPLVETLLPVLEERLRALVGAEGQAALDDLSRQREEARRRATAQARLADLNAVLLLDPAQERALGELLLDQGDPWLEPGGAGQGELSPRALAEITDRLAAAGDDGSGFTAVARDVVRAGIESALRPLGGVLSADQLESYRAHLEDRHARWLMPDP